MPERNIPGFQAMRCDYPSVTPSAIDGDGVVLHAETEGRGLPLILLHGGPGGSHQGFHPHLSGLAGNHTLVFFDQRGCGQSSESQDQSAYRLEDDVNDLHRVIDHFGFVRINLLGYSHGGIIAILFAAAYPDLVDKLVVCSCPMGEEEAVIDKRCQDRDEVLRQSGASDEELYHRFYCQQTVNGKSRIYSDRVRAYYSSDKGRRVMRLIGQCRPELAPDEIVERLGRLTCPVLLMVGKHDPIANWENTLKISASLPNSQAKVFEESSHDIFHDEPEHFCRVIAVFLAGSRT